MADSTLSLALRIYSSTLDADAISRCLSIKPSIQRNELSRDGASTLVWHYDVISRSEQSVSKGLSQFCDRLSYLRDELRCLSKDAKIYVWGAVFADRPETTVEISNATLLAVAELSLNLCISVYQTA